LAFVGHVSVELVVVVEVLLLLLQQSS
jgi:hypothetical protein